MPAVRICTISLIAALLTITCGPARVGAMELIQHGETEDVYQVTVHRDVEPFQLHLLYNDDPDFKLATEMKVYRGEKLLQTLPIKMIEPPYKGADFFLSGDMNFDGYKDLRLLISWGVTGNTFWSFWLYDPVKELFIHSKRLTNLGNARAYGDRTLISGGHAGMAGRIYSYGIYRWEGSKLILIREAEQDYNEQANQYHKVIRELHDGTMEVVSDKMLTEEEAIMENQDGTQLEY